MKLLLINALCNLWSGRTDGSHCNPGIKHCLSDLWVQRELFTLEMELDFRVSLPRPVPYVMYRLFISECFCGFILSPHPVSLKAYKLGFLVPAIITHPSHILKIQADSHSARYSHSWIRLISSCPIAEQVTTDLIPKGTTLRYSEKKGPVFSVLVLETEPAFYHQQTKYLAPWGWRIIPGSSRCGLVGNWILYALDSHAAFTVSRCLLNLGKVTKQGDKSLSMFKAANSTLTRGGREAEGGFTPDTEVVFC